MVKGPDVPTQPALQPSQPSSTALVLILGMKEKNAKLKVAAGLTPLKYFQILASAGPVFSLTLFYLTNTKLKSKRLSAFSFM